PWQRVVVDRPEHLVLALVAVSGEGEAGELQGYVVEPRGWALHGAPPALWMGPGWPETFPELAEGPPPEAWRGAWRAWCQGHGVPPGEAEGCSLDREGVRLRVEAPRELMRRLRAANGEAPPEDVWLLAGEGAVRSAARVEWMT